MALLMIVSCFGGLSVFAEELEVEPETEALPQEEVVLVEEAPVEEPPAEEAPAEEALTQTELEELTVAQVEALSDAQRAQIVAEYGEEALAVSVDGASDYCKGRLIGSLGHWWTYKPDPKNPTKHIKTCRYCDEERTEDHDHSSRNYCYCEKCSRTFDGVGTYYMHAHVLAAEGDGIATCTKPGFTSNGHDYYGDFRQYGLCQDCGEIVCREYRGPNDYDEWVHDQDECGYIDDAKIYSSKPLGHEWKGAWQTLDAATRKTLKEADLDKSNSGAPSSLEAVDLSTGNWQIRYCSRTISQIKDYHCTAYQLQKVSDKVFVTFDANGGKWADNDTTKKVAVNDTTKRVASLPENPTREGYVFDGWYYTKDGTGTKVTASATYNESTTVYAKWSNATYTVRFNNNPVESAAAQPKTQKIARGTATNLTANSFTEEHYNFAGWNTKADGKGTSYSDKQYVKDLTDAGKTIDLYAQWTPKTYKVTLDPNGATIASGKNITSHTYGKSETLPTAEDMTKTGSKFVGWYDSMGNPVTSIPADQDHAVTYWCKWLDSPVINAAPTAKTLTYDGTAQKLVNAGDVTGGTVKYMLVAKDAPAPKADEGAWVTEIPKAQDADTYYIYWYVDGDDDHLDSEVRLLEPVINKKEITVSGITAKDKTYDATTDATLDTSKAVLAGIVAADSGRLLVEATGAFSSPAASSTAKTVTLSGLALKDAQGADVAKNYTLAASGQQSRTQAKINPAELTAEVDGLTTKPYDGNTSVTDSSKLNVKLTGVLAADTGKVSVGSADYAYETNTVDKDKKIIASNVKLTGASAGNYVLKAGEISGNVGEITKATISAEVKIDNWTYGETAKQPKVTDTSNPGGAVVTYEYKVKGAEDTTYTTTVPENAGKYTVRATVPATGGYDKATATADFEIYKAKSRVVTPPAPIANLKNDGTEKVLATAGTAENGTLKYSLDPNKPKDQWTSDITTLKGRNKGAYPIYYYVDGTDPNYEDTEVKSINCAIGNGVILYSVSGYTDVYDAQAHRITVTLTAPADAKIQYSDSENGRYRDRPYTYKDVGEYTVWFTIKKDGYTDVKGSAKVTITPKEVTVADGSLAAKDKVYDGTRNADIEVTKNAKLDGVYNVDAKYVTIQLASGGTNGGTFVDANAGTDKAVKINREKISLTGDKAKNYLLVVNGSQIDAKADITPKPVDLEWTNTTLTYNGNPQKPTATVEAGQLIGEDNAAVSVTGEQTNAGDNYTATASLGNGNYSIQTGKTTKFKILAKSMEDPNKEFEPAVGFTVQNIADQTYTGSDITPTPVVLDGQKELLLGTDFRIVEYENNKYVGTATAVIQGINNYKGTIKKTFQIVAADAALTPPTVKENLIYNGELQELATAGSSTDGTLEYIAVPEGDPAPAADATDWSPSLPKEMNAGEYDVYYKLVPDGNHKAVEPKKAGTAKISAKSIVDPETSTKPAAGFTVEGTDDQVYTGSKIKPIVVKDGGKELVEGEDYTIVYSDNEDVGTATAVIVGIGNYEGTLNVSFEITPKPIKVTKIDGVDKVYDGTTDADLDTGNMQVEGKVDGDDVTVTPSGSFEDPNVGENKDVNITYELTGEDAKNYKIDDGSDDSTKADINAKSIVVPDDPTKPAEDITLNPETIDDQEYTGDPIKPGVAIRDGDYELVEGKDYTLEYKDNVNVGEATVIVHGKGNYKGDLVLHFNIVPKEMTGGAEPIDDQKYTGKEIEPDVVIKDGDKKLKEGRDYELEYKDNVEIGEATVIVRFKGNYSGEMTLHFNIVEKPVKPVKPAAPKTGDSNMPALWAALALSMGLGATAIVWKKKEH